MAIRIDIHSIKNVDRTGTERPYVKLIPQPARTAEKLEEDIQQSCTLTRSLHFPGIGTSPKFIEIVDKLPLAEARYLCNR